MQVSCPGCKREYKIDETQLPDAGRKMRCPKCAKVFVVTKKGAGTPPPIEELKAAPVKPSPPLPRSVTAGSAEPPLSGLPKVSGGALPKPNLTLPNAPQKNLGAPKAGIPGPGKVPSPKLPTPAHKEIELDFPPAPSEDDFSDIRVPSFAPSAQKQKPLSAPPASVKSGLDTAEFDLDADLEAPSLAPMPPISKKAGDTDDFDFSGFDDPIPSSPPKAAAGGSRNTVNLPSVSAPSPTIDLDDDDEFSKGSSPSLPAALGLPETADEVSFSGISFHETPSLQTIPPPEATDNFGEIDFGPTVEKSGAAEMDDDAEFDFNTASSDDESEADDDLFNRGSFGEIELVDSTPPAAPKQTEDAKPHFGAPPSRRPAPPLPPPPTEKVAIPDSFIPNDAVVSSLPPLGAAMESYAAPFDGMPSPADLLNLAAEPPLRPRTTQDIVRPSAEMLSRVEGTGTTDYGEVDLSPNETSGVLDIEAEEFDAFPVQGRGTNSIPSDLDLAADPMSLRTEAVPMEDMEASSEGTDDARKRGAFEGRRRFERQSRRSKILLLGLLVMLTFAGASLSFTSLGPFGANILFRLLPKPVNTKAVSSAKLSAEKKIRQDTFSAYTDAISETEAAYKEYPGSADLQFFLTYLYYMSELRFGVDKAFDARAKEVLGVAGFTEVKSEDAPLAQVSQYLRFSRPVPSDAPLTAALQKSSNGLVLLTEAALSKGDTEGALSAVKALDAKEGSPRSGFLAARVFIETGDKGLIAQAASRLAKIIETQPDHVDAGLLLAQVMMSQTGFDIEKVREVAAAVTLMLDKTPGATPAQKAETHAIAARLFVVERNYAAAEKEIAAAEKLNPENVSMLISKGRIALMRRDYSTAAAAFSKAVGNAPKNVWALLGKIETEIRGGELAESQKALVALMPNHNENAQAHYLMGEIRIALKENEEGEKEFKKAIELDSGLLEAYVSLSTFYLNVGRNDDAMAILDKASETVSGSPLIKKTLAAGHAARGDWASAIVELDNALKIDSDDVEAHFQMALMYRKMGSLDDAKRALDEVNKRNADYPGLALEQGLLMEQRGDVASALSAYKKALSLSPNDTGLKLRVGAASFLAGDLETAEKHLKSVLENQPASPEANFYYGETLRTSKRTAESLGFLLKATELFKDNALYHLRYAMALEETRDNERAMAELETTIRLEPQNAEAYIVMGKIRLRRGAVRDAVQNLEKGLSLDPNLSDGYLAAAEAYEQLSDMSSARKYYQKAAAAQPDNPEVHYRLGLAVLQVNGKAASYDGFARAAALGDKTDPKPEWFFEALYRRGVGERAKGMHAQAVATFKRYLKEAPENAIDRAEVVANLDDMGM